MMSNAAKYGVFLEISIAALSVSTLANAQVENAGAEQSVENSANGSGLEEIIVTATKRETSVQTTAAAVTAIGGDQLLANNIGNVADLQRMTPGLVVGAYVGQEINITLRGISSGNQGIGGNSPIAMYIDGVYTNAPLATAFEFADIDRVEVLRGPQGTLYGRNNTAGAINIITLEPGQDFRARVTAGIGNFNSFRGSASISGPVSDTLSAKLGISMKRGDGFLRRFTTGRPVDNESSDSLTAGLRWEPSGDTSFDLRADYSRARPPATIRILTPERGKYGLDACPVDCDIAFINLNSYVDVQSWGLGLTSTHDFGAVTLKSITGYRGYKRASLNDGDQSEFPLRAYDQFDNSHQFTQEFNLSNSTKGRLDWLLGLYAFTEGATAQGNNVIYWINPEGGASLSTQRSHISGKGFAGFADANFHVTDRLTLHGGVRLNWERKAFERVGSDIIVPRSDPLVANPPTDGTGIRGPLLPQYDVSTSWVSFTPQASIEYKFAEDIFGYASIGRGFKSGGYSFTATGVTDPSFGPENLTAYEVGLKTELFDRQLRLNFAGYYYDYSGLQQSIQLAQNLRRIFNAGTARVIGADLEMAFAPRAIDGLRLSGFLSYTDGTYRGFDVDYTAFGPTGATAQCPGGILSAALVCDLSGNKLPRTPKWRMSGSIQYEIPFASGSLTPKFDLLHETKSYFNEQNLDVSSRDRFTEYNARLTYATGDKRWQIAAWVLNLTDKRYLTAGFYGPQSRTFLPDAPFPGGAQNQIGTVNRPRTYGLEATFRY